MPSMTAAASVAVSKEAASHPKREQAEVRVCHSPPDFTQQTAHEEVDASLSLATCHCPSTANTLLPDPQ